MNGQGEGYQSPIKVIMGQMNISYEDEICREVQNVGINVDKNELLKALQYDRGQYQKGYADRDSELVRCHECIRRGTYDCPIYVGGDADHGSPDDWFCGDGERSGKYGSNTV